MSKRLDSMDIRLVWVVEDVIDGIHLQPQQGLNILRILQESFTNTLKHAKATKIQFHAYQENERIIIHIEDNGHFIDSENCHGQGIQNMTWRAEQISAQIEIKPSNNHGCSVILSIPASVFPESGPQKKL